MTNASRRQYEARMHRVQAHIDRHLDAPLDLEALAAVAHFSPYHFHRLFLAWTGQTLGGYLARRRLEKGAQRLRGQPESTVLEIALSVGYGSAEAFARAFKAHFGHSPTQWRRARSTPNREVCRSRSNRHCAPTCRSYTRSATAPTSPSVPVSA